MSVVVGEDLLWRVCGGCNVAEGRHDDGWCLWRVWGARPTINRRAFTMVGCVCGGCGGLDQPTMNRRAETMMAGACGGCGGLDQQ